MKRRLVLIAFLLFATYTPFHTAAHEERPKDYIGFVADLTSAGGIIETDGEIAQPFFSVKGHRIIVNGGDVQVFEYPSHTKATAEVARISPDGSSIGTTQANWTDKPHFYNSGKLIILYLGDNVVIENLIESVVGSQFAGK
jgi:hypothetical protein